MVRNNESRRGVLKSIGAGFAGITGVATVASEPVSAAKEHTGTIRAESGSCGYHLRVSDSSANGGI